MTIETDRAAQRARVERFAREHPGSVMYDGATLLDVYSGKALHLDWMRVARLEERSDAETGRPYLALGRDDGSEVAMAEQGVVFPPCTTGTGPLEGLPRAVCFRDLAQAEGRLTHFLLDHPDERPSATHVSLFLFCLAVVDGARAAGFDVSREERRLEAVLNELEARKRG
ncbi:MULTISPECIES: hypothetical protein [Anaeromyxobacter]|uniref:Uncharacterized protein n=1 Tax=Anaeromyxobacter dehalogenans (strain 2CP-C) TaxID=290397 RepID=Q2ILC2_ANADE|nr:MULTISPECIES: hypothetical protein [Anaeromyxobacter]ABC82448.1 hypothetical protein Adeh_2678 [Anaeromyxobacter dehalogenans 2CP-C]GAO01901.1 hypothetical protein PSR1_00763 [Anaeromyxobacter sp. PSR-1]